MKGETEINSPQWWEGYFKSSWEAHGGREQTRTFTTAAMMGLDAEEVHWLNTPGKSICDWGCAMGDGVALMAARFPQARVCGLDSAFEAIRAARNFYPNLPFGTSWSELLPHETRFDAVLCSNCLEHFDDPEAVVIEHLQHVDSLYVVLVPYQEAPLSPTHKISWDENTLRASIAGFTRLYWKRVAVDPAIWPGGQQLLMVYTSAAYAATRPAVTATVREKAKWDAIYSTMPLVDVSTDDVVTAFNNEMLDVIAPLIPAGSKVLEAGCGGGAQSLTLAQRGDYRVSLLDFSPKALDYAQRLFAQHNTPVHTEEADAFSLGVPEHDLVFNAGVLEHYSFDEQVRFIKGMASRSVRYVMVLIPNRACYWYWIWRLQKSAKGEWPYGKEVPLVDMEAAFAAAGLKYLGQAFVGRRWSQSFVEGLDGLSDELREMILQAQRSDVLPSHAEGYLLAALGSVQTSDKLPKSPAWSVGGVTELRVQADQTAMMADAIANDVASRVAVRRANLEIDTLRREADQHNVLWQQSTSQLQAALVDARSREAATRKEAMLAVEQAFERSANAQREAMECMSEAQRAASENMQSAQRHTEMANALRQQSLQDALDRQELAQQREHALQMAALEAQQQAHLARQETERLRLQVLQLSLSWRATRPIRFMGRLMRQGLVQEDRAKLKGAARKLMNLMPLPVSMKRRLTRLGSIWLRSTPTNVSSHAGPPTHSATPASSFPSVEQSVGKLDYFFWGVIDWHLRYQRPQQLAKGLADNGRRVFYISSELQQANSPGYTYEKLDDSGRLFQIHFQVSRPVAIYGQLPDAKMLKELRVAIGALLRDANVGASVQVVQHPFWTEVAGSVPNSRSAYDCMDHHAGFDNTSADIVEAERALFRRAEDIIVSSQWLLDEVGQYNKPAHLIRNGCEHNHFATAPAQVYKDAQGRKIIGYYGAIAHWMDIDLLRSIARAFPEAVVLMVGADTTGAQKQLKEESNIEWIGEVPYTELPYYAHAFSVAMLPFKVIPLTLATNPVKVYEYLSSGLDVVCIELPETLTFASVVRVAKTPASFVHAVGHALKDKPAREVVQRRREFAQANTWHKRIEEFVAVFENTGPKIPPRISVVVVTYNNIALTRACLDSLCNTSALEALEVVVVDNASSDGTPEMLEHWVTQGPWRKLILNSSNLGFAKANNQGLEAAMGDFLCLLNNDTYVTPGWASTLRTLLQNNPEIGVVGPVTNNIGNEAKIAIDYADMAEMTHRAGEYTTRHLGKTLTLPVVAFFCVMLTRDTLNKVGLLDEAFGLGFFEDDDYCHRVVQVGLRVACCESVFVHHHLSASFDKLPSKDRQALMDKNKAIFESKWGKWVPHAYR